MKAFEPTPLRPENPASYFEVELFGPCTSPLNGKLIADGERQIFLSTGLSARQHAAISLCVPDSGCDWLDAMIEQHRRDEFARKAMSEFTWNANIEADADRCMIIADAMLAASKKDHK